MSPRVSSVSLPDLDADSVGAFAREQGVGLVVVGPEAPLVAGLADGLKEQGLACFGCSAKAAE
jgi:phosphoribosylamine--glycine ligase